MHDLAALAHIHGKVDDRVVTGLAVDFGEQDVGFVLGEEAAARNRRQLTRIAKHQDRRAEAHQVAAERLVDHRTFVDDDELPGRCALPVEREQRRDIEVLPVSSSETSPRPRPVDQRMDRLARSLRRGRAAPAPPCR
jgi:hypothetical protein